MKQEAKFEKQIAGIAGLYGSAYFKIPDTRMLNAKNRWKNREAKRPFDGILVTPHKNICIEVKYQYNQLEPHQKINEQIINDINNKSFFVVRKRKLKNATLYSVEKNGKKVFENTEIERMIEWLIIGF